MVNDFEQRCMVWKPEYVAFATENGRTPEEQDAHDHLTPEMPRAAFAAWLAKRSALPVLTQSEVRWAKILAAYIEGPDEVDEHMADIGWALYGVGLTTAGEPTDKGRALLDRARKAGVL